MKRRHLVAIVIGVLVIAVAILIAWRELPAIINNAAEPSDQSAQPRSHAGDSPLASTSLDGGLRVSAPELAPIRLSNARGRIDPSSDHGVLSGTVVSWATNRPIAGAELTFAGPSASIDVHSDAQGRFELRPNAPGTYTLLVASAQGFLPFAPDFGRSPIRFEARDGAAVEGVSIYLVDEVQYTGRVIDAQGNAVEGAQVRLLGTSEQSLLPLTDRFTTDAQGEFRFSAPDGAVLEADHPERGRGRASIDDRAQVSHHITIRLHPGAFAASERITGRVQDERGAAIEGARVSAAFLTGAGHGLYPPIETRSGSEGRFTLSGLERGGYRITANAEGYAASMLDHVATGATDVLLVLRAQSILRVRVVDERGEPAAAITVVVERVVGPLERSTAAVESGYDQSGVLEMHGLGAGSYEVTAIAPGRGPSAPRRVELRAGERAEIEITLSAAAAIAGIVMSEGGGPVVGARVTTERRIGGSSAVPLEASALTDASGHFMLQGVASGPCSIVVWAEGHHGRIRSGIVAREGAVLDAGTIELAPLDEGEEPGLELAGIGAVLTAQGEVLVVQRVIAGGGAAEVGLGPGAAIVAIDGAPVTELGFQGSIERIRGIEGTHVLIQLRGVDTPLAVPRRRIRA